MADTNTEKLRERLVASTGEHPAVFGAAEVAFLLVGLDIAERMAETLRHVRSVKGEKALAKWDKWQGGRPTRPTRPKPLTPA